jgi:hypothetical protein
VKDRHCHTRVDRLLGVRPASFARDDDVVLAPFALRTAPRVGSLLDEASALISADRELRVAELERTFTIRINDGVAATTPSAVTGGPRLPQLCRHLHISASRRGLARGPLDDALDAAGLRRHVAAVVPTFAVAALLVTSSDYVGLVPQRLAEQHGRTLGVRWFPIPAALPELDVRMHWHARLDADPAQRWLRDTIRNAHAKRAAD